MPSFDTVLEPNLVELRNAVDQSNKEIGTRFDFKGSAAKIESVESGKDRSLQLHADSDFQIAQVRDILTAKLTKIQGIVKQSKLKVQAAIQGDSVRITGAKRDDLQAAIALLKKDVTDVPLAFNNFRD